MKIRLGIVGYGNLGRGAELAADKNPDVKIEYIFTRREPKSVKTYGTPVFPLSEIGNYKGELDCLILAGGSRSDLPTLTPMLAESFNVVDSFDTHSAIQNHVKNVDLAARAGERCAVVSAGWDPGILSLARLFAKSFMPYATVNTFWGNGVSQGHSDAIRRIKGVIKAVQYTVPTKEARLLAENGISVPACRSHKRVCYVVAAPEDEERIRSEIISMKDYFSDYETEVHFIGEEEFDKQHRGMPHRGELIAKGMSGVYKSNAQSMRLSLELDSNPEFTSYVMIAAARAAVRLRREGMCGAYTFFDIPPKYFFSGNSDTFL